MIKTELRDLRQRPQGNHSRLLRPFETVRKELISSPWLRRPLYFAVPVLVLSAIWWSVIKYYYVPTPVITKEMVEHGRQDPPDDLLDELIKLRFFDIDNRLYTVETAEKLLQGELALPGEVSRRIHLPFDSHEVFEEFSGWELFHARLVIPRILLNAYRITKREDFFLMARDVILGWAAYERRAILPKGSLWGDHAISERVFALVDFWAVYRHHPSYNDEVAHSLFVFAARSGYFLSDPAFFLLLSNHGVMQNLGLWHLSLGFPSLPETRRYPQVAFERMGKLMGFYVNDEGFVLEHSTGYQKTGVQFMSMAFRYLTLLGMQIPLEWQQKFERAINVYVQLRRPDGSWPMFGDTEGGVGLPGPFVPSSNEGGRYGPLKQRIEASAAKPDSFYPVAGYAIWWSGLNLAPKIENLSQTVVAWSYFLGHAHKHADEMSVLLWADGLTWWSNVGYWPYAAWRSEAESWNGSNAPHVTGEPVSSARKTNILGYAKLGDFAFIDLERRGPQAYVARRQVVQALNGLWVVLDHTSGNVNDRTTTLWTTSHNVEMTEGIFPGSYELKHSTNQSVMDTFVFGSSGTSLRRYKGSYTPFAGWQMGDEVPRPAQAIMIEQPAKDSWCVAVWSLSAESKAKMITAMPSMSMWNGPESWTISFPRGSKTIQLSREAEKVYLKDGRPTPLAHLTLKRLVGIEQKITEIQAAHDRVREEYPTRKFQDAVAYRYKATYLVILLLFLQEVFFAVYKRFTQSHCLPLRGLSAVVWVVLGIWLVTRVPLI